MRIPDWIVLLLVLSVVLWALFSGEKEADAPEAPPDIFSDIGPLLPDPDQYDEQVLVQVGDISDGVGTAFALDTDGVWMTARHVVDGCETVGLAFGGGRLLPVSDVRKSPESDIALLYTRRAPRMLKFANRHDLRVGETGFHVGYPQGQPGEVTSRLLSRSRLITRGRYRNEEPVLAWAEMGRTRGLNGTLAGISGGPVFDGNGGVVGVTVAESPRRGRIYTTAPNSVSQVLSQNQLETDNGRAFQIDLSTYGREADRLRRELSVVKVICRADNEA